MTERSDLSVEWNRSPRIITVAAPSTNINMQDLVDTLKGVIETSYEGLDNPYLHTSSGKDALDDVTNVGITVTLLDAQIAFEARYTPLSAGTATSNDADGRTLTDIGATFQSDGVTPGDTVINFDDFSLATVIEVLSEIAIYTYPLQSGSLNQWTIGDNYRVFHVEQCEIDGGNLVATDSTEIDEGNAISPVSPTAFTQVVKTSSSSATLTEDEAMRIAILGGRVVIDYDNGFPGTEWPTGTLGRPAKYLKDAQSIGTTNNIRLLTFLEDYIVASDDVLDNWILQGVNHHVDVHVSAGATTDETEFKNLGLTGTLAGASIGVTDCRLGTLTGLSGDVTDSTVVGVVQIAGTADTYFNKCGWRDGAVLDMLNAECSVHALQTSGHVTVRNHDFAGKEVCLAFVSGKATFESSCVAGSAVVSGAIILVDNSPLAYHVNRDAQLQGTPTLEASMSDDGNTSRFILWCHRAGVHDSTITGISAVVRNYTGTQIYDLGAGTGPDAQGCFYFSCSSTLLPANTALYVDGTATDGVSTYRASAGVTRVA